MRRTPIHKYPSYVTNVDPKIIESQNKRLYLKLIIDESKSESIIVILKNPSRANGEDSDLTINRVTNYIHLNRLIYTQLEHIKEIIILNLIPYYKTDSKKLTGIRGKLNDSQNLAQIQRITKEHTNVIIAWGNHPKGLRKEFEEIKNQVREMLIENRNKIFCVSELTKSGNPKHGQRWSYQSQLYSFTFS